MNARKENIILSIFLLINFGTLIHSRSYRNARGRREAEHQRTEPPIVYLTVASLVPGGKDRLLELNWENIPPDVDRTVSLYDRDPASGASPLSTVRPTSPGGYHRTSIQFPRHTFTKDNLTSACLGYWIGYRRDDELVASNCIRAQPHWMRDARSSIANLSLIDLMLPGTHNAGSYWSYVPREDNMYTRYIFTQDESIWNQLVYGIRYVDLRVAYHASSSSPEQFWITHSSFRTDITVREVARQVKEFLKATDEIVVMDFHRFVTGFQRRSSARRRHEELTTLLEEELGEFMIPVHFTSWATLDQLWSTNRRLYVGYADERGRRRSPFLFPAVKHLWGEVDEVDDLRRYLNGTVCDASTRRKRLTSAMAQLTPTPAGVLFNSYGGLRKMADEVNRRVTRWFRKDWNACANIIATDYFLGNNIVELAIETNRNKSVELEHGLK